LRLAKLRWSFVVVGFLPVLACRFAVAISFAGFVPLALAAVLRADESLEWSPFAFASVPARTSACPPLVREFAGFVVASGFDRPFGLRGFATTPGFRVEGPVRSAR
jgi:hypothetical protein